MFQPAFRARLLYAIREYGMTLWQEALIFGLVSAASLPVGAYLGQRMSPVKDDVVAALVAFGAGALLFAVTVELYGHALHEVAHGKMGYAELGATITCALLGALLYLYLNKMMEEWMDAEAEEGTETETGAATSSGSGGENPASSSGQPTQAQSRWAQVRQHAKDVGAEALKRTVVSAKEAMSLFVENNQEEKERLEGIRGRQKRVMIAAAATTPKARSDQRVLERERTPQEIAEDEEEEKRIAKGLKLAHAMFLGLLVDGIPESILLGCLAAERSLSLVLVLSLFVANFPEAFSSASLMKEAGVPTFSIIGMWSALCILTGVLAALACAGLVWVAGEAAAAGTMPFHIAIGVACVEGIAGGAMIACIASVMLPEAFARKNKGSLFMDSGFLCTAGFLLSVLIKVTGGIVDSHRVEKDAKAVEENVKTAVPHDGHAFLALAPDDNTFLVQSVFGIMQWGLTQANAGFLADNSHAHHDVGTLSFH